jgi:CAAX prenyl protease-like protein
LAAETEESAAAANDRTVSSNPWLPYVAPMAAFMLITALEGQFRAQYPLVYIIKVIMVTICVWFFRGPLREIKVDGKFIVPAVLVGAAVFAEWIWLDRLTHYPHLAFLGKRTEYNPFVSIANPMLLWLFLASRFYGLALLVPLVEEVFWRSFLLRIFTDPDDFQRVRLGEFSWIAFAVVAAAFGLSHPEWLEAIICAIAYGLLLRQTRSLFACVVAHATTNLMLGIYVVTQHAWSFW